VKALAVIGSENEGPELLTASRTVADEVVAVAAYPELKADSLGRYGATSVVVLKGDIRDPRALSGAIAGLVREERADLVLALSTKNFREALTRAAQLLGVPLITDCLELRVEDKTVKAGRLVLGGGYVATVEAALGPVFATLMPGRVTPQELSGQASVKAREVEVKGPINGELKEVRPVERSAVDLTKAGVIVSVGRGFKKRGDLKLAEELAQVLGAEIGCSRPIAGDLKWLPEDRHIGLSGKWVSPKLYIAVGISGQMQHLVGIRRSKIIVAINNDPNAPIHKEADYSVIADLYQFLPVLTRKLREAKK
jgi:electron transfer flavoprotein alpha subunit